jgi:hypothetical protein
MTKAELDKIEAEERRRKERAEAKLREFADSRNSLGEYGGG